MSLESNQRSTVIRLLAPLHANSVENLVVPGYPDIEFVGGTLELKAVDKWPRGEDTVLTEGVDRKHFTPQQRVWAMKRRRAQGFHCVCLQVNQDWFLIEGIAAAQHLGIDWTRQGVIDESWKHWLGGLDKKEFYECILKATEAPRNINWVQ